MQKAIITGSFDPVTRGHTDIIEAAAHIFDHVYVCIVNNTNKQFMFTESERLQIMQAAVDAIKGCGAAKITVDSYSGLTSKYMSENGITCIVRGVRNSSDFDYEYGMVQIMKKFLPGCETLFIPAKPENLHISSTFVREIIKYGGPLEEAVPDGTAVLIRKLYSAKKQPC